MGVIMLGSGILHRKNDTWTSISCSLLIILIYNPFLIKSLGLLLSYGGTIGIITFNKNVLSILDKVKIRNKKYKYRINKKLESVIKYVKETLTISISAQICLIPIIITFFNTVGIAFIFTSIFVSLIIGPIVIVGFIAILFSFISINLLKFFSFILNPLLYVLILTSKLGKWIPLNKVYIATPNMVTIMIYYCFVYIFNVVFRFYNSKKITTFEYRVRNIISLIKYNAKQNKKKILSFILAICIFFSLIKIIPQDLKIYFIDVGQGDSTLIVTPRKQSILIDGGGSMDSAFDVGKNTLLPYLFDRKITKIDYIIVSHFDQDHSQSYAKILPELTASRIFITEQIEENDLFKQIMAIAKEKNIKVTYVKAGDIINIDGVKFSILHPQKELITNNGMNNNSMVCKLEYKSFSMLFTGDIEKEAEELILNKNIDIKADVLKVAHHRF